MRLCQQKLGINLLLFVFLLSVLPSSVGFAQSGKLKVEKYEYEYEEPYDYKPSTTAVKAFDVIIVRPVMMGVSVFGLAAFVGSLPFTATGIAGIDISTARKKFISYPLNYTFKRPIGDFNEQE